MRPQVSGPPIRPARLKDATRPPTKRASAFGGGASKQFVVLASEFHPAIARALVRGATDTLRRHGVSDAHVRLLWVPGAFELPVFAARLARRRPTPDAIIALGCLIRGETPQYEVIAHAVAQGLSQVSVMTGVPVTFGVIVAATLAQAKARAGGSSGHRGKEAALAALAVLSLLDRHDA